MPPVRGVVGVTGAEADLAWCVEEAGDDLVLYPSHDWVPIEAGQLHVVHLLWCQRCRKYEPDRKGPTL